VSDHGVELRSHLDGSRHLLTPETAVRIQDELGTDIAMSLDEPIELPAAPEAVGATVERTIAWAARGIEERERLAGEGRCAMALFGINQGGTDRAERRRCFEGLRDRRFDGWVLGGLWVGEGRFLGLVMVGP